MCACTWGAGEGSPLVSASPLGAAGKPSAVQLLAAGVAPGVHSKLSSGGRGGVALLHQKGSVGAASAEEAWTIHTLDAAEAAAEARNNLAV